MSTAFNQLYIVVIINVKEKERLVERNKDIHTDREINEIKKKRELVKERTS